MYPGGGEAPNSGGAGESSSSSEEAESHATESMGKSAVHLEPFGASASFKLQILSKQDNSSSHHHSGSPCKSVGSFSDNSKNKVSVDDGERRLLLDSEIVPSPDTREDPENAALINFIAARAWKRCVSLPFEPALDLSPSASGGEATDVQLHASQRFGTSTKVLRSLSVPSRNIIIVRSGSFGSPQKLAPRNSEDGQISPTSISSDDVEIPEEEAVCRICLGELTEGRSWLKIECSCKGALRLIHEECALKWFSIKGNRNCDVCGQEVLNLPVTLLRVQSSAQRDNVHRQIRQSSNFQLTREWQDVVVLVLVGTMCYFFFIEQLLVKDMKAHAIIIAAPVSLTLAILSSLFAITLAPKEYVWAYSALQFSLVCVLLHLLYSTFRLRAMFAVLLSAVAGLGIAIGINSICLQLFAWRTRNIQARMNANPA